MPDPKTPDSAVPPDIAKLGFEEALQELEAIVRNLEGGKGRLEDSIKAYERGALLKQHCEAKLRDAQMKVDKIVLGPDGAVKTQSLD
jgi:exodeoxyribonuclease VII small subunit